MFQKGEEQLHKTPGAMVYGVVYFVLGGFFASREAAWLRLVAIVGVTGAAKQVLPGAADGSCRQTFSIRMLRGKEDPNRKSSLLFFFCVMMCTLILIIYFEA